MKDTLCFVGSNSRFSLIALQTLLAHKITLSHIILAGYGPAEQSINSLPVSPPFSSKQTEPTIYALADQHHIPIRYAGSDLKHFAHWENFPHDVQPDFLFVACFASRLPSDLRQWPLRAAINLHPSLLPAYRGPDPLFWQLRFGETNTGISLHLVTEALDAGPILLQKSVRFPQGASRDELDALMAQQGTEAFCAWLSTPTLKTIEQDADSASYHSLPQMKDYALNTDWSAEHAYNFIRGTDTPLDGYPIVVSGQQHHIASAMGFEAHQSLDNDIVHHANHIAIQFSPGVLHAKAV